MADLISECAWCNKVKTPAGWKGETQALRALGVDNSATSRTQNRTHGICPACAAMLKMQWYSLGLIPAAPACN